MCLRLPHPRLAFSDHERVHGVAPSEGQPTDAQCRCLRPAVEVSTLVILSPVWRPKPEPMGPSSLVTDFLNGGEGYFRYTLHMGVAYSARFKAIS